ncbi:RagB/SusD family nutrient uptake outer membrane protein [Niabella yanshanensis]|uniref:RagB/SusD family nutrient uptake outer membrane protein n=1 Tax=Niabella yanshanensis TaxID=577386 RepID=A0ABZ0W5J8_9BACT|nr:RagB/SusD family nutrient uptake outer membrane protein [Niabella yanshanensis]WQD38568.1 RagB/SusD family nutrient uptake outer membrane protein [Niabella yanshanensis]
MRTYIIIFLTWCVLSSCNKDAFLNETPLSDLSPENVLKDVNGYENLITSLHYYTREELTGDDLYRYFDMFTGTDLCTSGQLSVTQFVNYETYLTPATAAASRTYNWCYTSILPYANLIIEEASKPENAGVFSSEAQKNAIIAEARFFRAYGHNILANLYGDICIMDRFYKEPKTDFVRSSRADAYKLIAEDLEFASQWLPVTVAKNKEGRIVKGAADHLLAEAYISLGQYDKAIAAADRVINSGTYRLMKERFGVNKDKPGDAFSDLFIQGNQNRSTGNMESIWVWQFEEFTPGGGGSLGGNHSPRGWLPFMVQFTDPAGRLGFALNADSLLRGVAIMRPNPYFLYDLWLSDWNNDMRNSAYNIKREFWYNNPASTYFGKKVEPRNTPLDTMQRLYPYVRKVEGKSWQGVLTNGRSGKDMIIYRLAETYLLKAEAYLRKGDQANAAASINVVRARANAKPVSASDVTLDYILDERGRELMAEEPRKRTLCRMGMLVERVKKYNMKAETRNSIAEKHNLYPIPQGAIDANFSVKLTQNTGY